ncbi:MAG: ABATE domain-containing protein [Chloroflexia bacterium]
MAAITEEKHTYEMVGGALCLDFVNTRSHYTDSPTPSNDHFDTYSEVLNWASQVGIITYDEEHALNHLAALAPARAEAALHKARELREAIQRTFLAAGAGVPPDARPFELLNREIAEAMSHARLVRTHDGYEWGWEPAHADLERILWPIAKSAADLLVSGKLARVHECAGDTCGWLFLDTSKNHSRRWCDMKDCGNTAKARRHYHRKVQGKRATE